MHSGYHIPNYIVNKMFQDDYAICWFYWLCGEFIHVYWCQEEVRVQTKQMSSTTHVYIIPVYVGHYALTTSLSDFLCMTVANRYPQLYKTFLWSHEEVDVNVKTEYRVHNNRVHPCCCWIACIRARVQLFSKLTDHTQFPLKCETGKHAFAEGKIHSS